MAKIGNEARLILKLAKERMATVVIQPGAGYKDAVREFSMCLDQIVTELERK